MNVWMCRCMCTMYVLRATISAEIALLTCSLPTRMCYYHLDLPWANKRLIDWLIIYRSSGGLVHVDGARRDLVGTRHAVELALLLTEQLEPAVDRVLDQLGHAERQRAHEVVARRPVPVPHLHRQPLGVVLRRQRTDASSHQRNRLRWHSTAPTRTPTRTSSPTSARGSSRECRRVRRLPCSACHEPNTHEDPRRLVRHARFSSRGCPLGMRACIRVLYTISISYRVHVYKITR